MLAVGLLAGGVLAAQPVAAGALADLAGHTVIATYTNTVTTENAGNRHASETHTCKVEAHFYFSTARKLFVTVTYRKCSHSSAVRNEPNADGGDLLDYSRGLTGLDENGFRFAIKDAGNALSLTNGGKGQVRVGNDGTRRQTTGTYKAAFTISGTSCTFRRTQQRSIEIWTATAHYVQTISETGVGTSCRIVAGRK